MNTALVIVAIGLAIVAVMIARQPIAQAATPTGPTFGGIVGSPLFPNCAGCK